MIRETVYQIAMFLLFPLTIYSQTTDNVELQKMYDEDQRSRRSLNPDGLKIYKADSIRQIRVYELIKEGRIVTGKDYHRSAMIFQHGRDSVAYGMAVKQMRKAIELDSTINKWLLAAAIDRNLMSRGKPQIYGTQYTKGNDDSKWVRYKIDTTQVTDAERKYYNVETLAQQREKERIMNLASIAEYNVTTGSIDKTIALIKSEKEKGIKSSYDVSEQGINRFGYELMNSDKINEALKIFMLNTELYPKGFNTWDSLGECLLKLGRKEEGLTAYRKSLELNPGNNHAIEVLSRK